MCWNLTASIIFTIIGFAGAIYLYKKKEDFFLWLPLIYFSLMELLQAATYLVIGRCDLPSNQILTYLGYLHISFQPFFVSMIAMYFIPKKVRSKIAPWVFTVCGVSAILMLIKVYPFEWAGLCKIGTEALCQSSLCSLKGGWHLAWYIPLNGLDWLLILGYTFPVFVLPFIYGSWRFNVFHIIFGPTLAYLLTFSLNEYAAVWCLFSILFLVVIFLPNIKKNFKVNKWYFWEYPFKRNRK